MPLRVPRANSLVPSPGRLDPRNVTVTNVSEP